MLFERNQGQQEAVGGGRGDHLGLMDGSDPDHLGALSTWRQDIKLSTRPLQP